MNRMNVSEVEELLKKQGYSEEEITEFIKLVEPFYNFYDYMNDTHNMSYEDVEKDSEEFSKDLFTDYLEEMTKSETPMKFMIEISGDIFKRYANKYDYPESEKVKQALIKYSELMLKSQIDKKE